MSATALVGLAPTILGPLTTVFTPPPACTVAVGQVDGGGGLLGLGGLLGGGSAGNFAFLGQGCSGGQPADAASCWPAPTGGAPQPPEDIGRWGVYSPGIECPAGYATACQATAGGASGWPLQFSLTAGETAVGCCPSGYGCANIGGQTCTMVASSTVVQTATCDGNKVAAPETTSAAAFSLYAPMIQLNFQSTDLPAASSGAGVVPVPVPAPTAGTFTTRTTTTVMAGSPSPTSSTTSQSQTSSSGPSSSPTNPSNTQQPQPTTSEQLQTASVSSTPSPSSTLPPAADLQSPSSPTSSSSPSSGFPRMAAVGIGVGGGVAALLIGGSALLYCLRRRRSRREEESLDRLYGLGKLDSITGSSRSDEFPGFYRGQMPTRGGGGSMRQVNF